MLKKFAIALVAGATLTAGVALTPTEASAWGWRRPYYAGYYGWGWRPHYAYWGWRRPYAYGWGWRRPYYAYYGWGWRRPYYAYYWRPRVFAYGW